MFWFKSLFTLLLWVCVVRGSLVSDIVDAIANAVSSTACHALLVPLQSVEVIGNSAFSDTFIAVCKVLHAQDDDVCEGIITQQGPVIAHALRSITPFGQTATKLCDSVLGLCQPPDINEYKVPFPKADPTTPKVWSSKGKAPIQVTHFSDAHRSGPGSDVNCTKSICCRNYADSAQPPGFSAGPIGEHKCDTSTKLVQSMLKAIPATNAFSIFTGDVVEGTLANIRISIALTSLPLASVWLRRDEQLENFNDEMATILNTPVYPVIGLLLSKIWMHPLLTVETLHVRKPELAPINDFLRSTADMPDLAQWVYDTQSQGRAKWINATVASQVAHNSGSYSIIHPGTSLRIISINTGYWYKAKGRYHLEFYEPRLTHSSVFGSTTMATSRHMPPGRQDALSDQSNYFNQIVQHYKNTIAAQFYGHSHQDEFQIAYSNYGERIEANAVGVAWRNGNPAFKTYPIHMKLWMRASTTVRGYNHQASLISNSSTANMAAATFQTAPTWTLHYSTRATWGSLVGAPSLWDQHFGIVLLSSSRQTARPSRSTTHS
ncbi:hypothetical protein DXG01_005164 [Tephrocybe rancida]|nr:hypothetical protein DXG01_005164 [Tephrocybe rancida]